MSDVTSTAAFSMAGMLCTLRCVILGTVQYQFLSALQKLAV